MNVHESASTTPHSRALPVERVHRLGWNEKDQVAAIVR